MFNLQNILSKTVTFSKFINNIVYRPLSTSSVTLRSIRDLTESTPTGRKLTTTFEGTIGSESWMSNEKLVTDDRLPTSDILTTSFDGILFKDLPIVYIKASKNNTIITITDSNFNIITSTSCRLEGFKNAKKKSTIAGQTTGEAAGQRLRRRGILAVRVVVKGIGPGRMSSVTGIANSGVNVVSITDNTPLKELGPRPRKIRRV